MICLIKKHKIKEFQKKHMINFGRGKRFKFDYIGNEKVRVYKRGLMIILNEKEFEDLFCIANR